MPKILILKNLNGLELAAIYGFNGLESAKYLNGLKKNGWARFGPKRLNEARRVGSRPWEKT